MGGLTIRRDRCYVGLINTTTVELPVCAVILVALGVKNCYLKSVNFRDEF